MIIKEVCPNKKCGKVQKEASFSLSGKWKLIKLECGHTICKEIFIDIPTLEPQPFKLISSDGQEARPYQYEAIEFAGQKGLRVLFADEMGLGKGGIHSEPILTPKGWKTYGTITLDDKVIGVDGKPYCVTGIYNRGTLQTYRVSFNDGSYTIVDGDHLWEVNTPVRKNRGVKPLVKNTLELKLGLFGSKNSTGKQNLKWYIPVTEPVEMEEQINRLSPYCMGLLLGDGCFTVDHKVSYSTEDEGLLFALRLGLESVGGELEFTGSGCNFRINKNSLLRDELSNYELLGKYSHEKFIPDSYRFNSIKNRLAILRGLMDTDGSIWNNGVIEFTSTSKRLAEDVQFLVQSLGGIALTSTKVPNFSYKGEEKEGKLCYRVVINIGINPFLLERKAKLYKRNEKYSPTRGIVSIEPHSVEPVICISTNAPRSLYLTRDCIVTHNTIQFLGTLARHKDKVFPVLIVTKKNLLVQTSRELLRWLGKEHFAQIITSAKEMILPNLDSYIISYDLVKRITPEKLRESINPKCLILDECQAIKNPESDRTVSVQRLASGIFEQKRVEKPNLNERKIIETIALDLMKYHGVYPRFKLNFEDLGPKKLGLCECKAAGEGIIEGRITINLAHALQDSINDVLETILHEIAHAITPGAGHKPIWSQTCKDIGGDGMAVSYCEGSVDFKKSIPVSIPYIMAASGTYIKNNAAEAFPIFNILKPERFPVKQGFINEFVDGYVGAYGNKYGGIKRHALDSWKKTTGEFIIRRERSEVLKELPPLGRSFFYTELGELVERLYKETMKKFQSAFDEMENSGGWDKLEARQNVLSYITKMRHLTGISKVDPCVEWTEEFLEETNRKLAIFVHHQDVGETLFRKIDALCMKLRLTTQIGPPIQYTSAMSLDARQRAIERFRGPDCRVGVFSTLAAGEGLNLQFCSDMILLERQWNPANEEQVEGRFNRIGQENNVNATYFLAGGTIDEYFSELVENKRKYMLQTMRGDDTVNFVEGSLMRELAEIIASKGGKKWKL